MGAFAPAALRRGAICGAVCLALAGSGCIVPIGPEFQDPPAPQNYQPIILDAEPDLGSRVSNPKFSVTVQDPNVSDTLYVRFVADYPLLTEDTKVLGTVKVPRRPDGRLLAEEAVGEASCLGLANRPSHQITVIVADREFLDGATVPGQLADPARLPTDARKVVGSWTLDLECP
jgi:hypothetical protein